MAAPFKISSRNQALLDAVDPELVRQADEAFDNELMCAQVAFIHGAEKLGYDVETATLASSGFGWGMQHGERCGAVTGALMALGLKYGYRSLEEFPNYKILKKKQAEFDKRFKEGVGSLYCKEILKGNYGVPEEREQIYEEERYRVCALVTAYAVTILDELLDDTSDDAALIRSE